MPLTNFPNGVTSFGVPQFGPGGLVPVPGDVYWVHPGGTASVDGNSGLSPERARVTVSSVQSSMTANQNDTVILIGSGSASATNVVSESATQTWSKDLTHILGTAYNHVAHRVSVRPSATSITITFTVTADGCVWSGFHITNQATANTSRAIAMTTGQRNAFYNLHIAAGFNQTGADLNNIADIAMGSGGNGENYLYGCTIGLDTVSRAGTGANILLENQTARNMFEKCIMISHCDATGFLPLTIGSLGIDRYVIFKDCLFTSAGAFTGGSTPAQCCSINASIGGVVIWDQTFAVGFTAVETTASTNLYVQNLYGAGTTALGIANTV